MHVEKNEHTDNLLLHGKTSKKQSSCHMINKNDGCLGGLAIRSDPKLPQNALNRKGWNGPGEIGAHYHDSR